MYYTNRLLKLADKFELQIKSAGWFGKDAEEKLISELDTKEFIELCQKAGLQNVKETPSTANPDDFSISFTYNTLKYTYGIVVFKDGSGGQLFAQGLDSRNHNGGMGCRWSLPRFKQNATGADLVMYLGAARNTSSDHEKNPKSTGCL